LSAPGRNPPAPPFQLSPKEQVELDKILDAWEQKNGAITSFKANFDRWQYDPLILPKRQGQTEQPIQTSNGEIKYVAPDKGMLRETSGTTLVENQTTHKLESRKLEKLQYWACDGKMLYSVDNQQKVVEEIDIPPELQGKAITQGPLPFVFGAKAAELKARYFIRPLIPPADRTDEYWLEVRPKFMRDAENFSRVQIILDSKTLFPKAIELLGTNGTDRDVYVLTPKGLLDFNLPWRDDFSPSPFGYKHVKNGPQAPAAPQPGSQNGPGAATPSQAQRYLPGVNRR
jgi:TIGR03009 family protein